MVSYLNQVHLKYIVLNGRQHFGFHSLHSVSQLQYESRFLERADDFLSLAIQILKTILRDFWQSHCYRHLFAAETKDYKRHLEGTFLRGFSDKSTRKIKANLTDVNLSP